MKKICPGERSASRMSLHEGVQTTGGELSREANEFITYVFNNIQDGISILDLDLNIIGVNNTMEKWYSHSMPLVGNKCYVIYHNRKKPCLNCPTMQAIHTEITVAEVVRYDGPDSSLKGRCLKGWQKVFAIPLYDSENRLTGIIEHVRDITNTKKYEETVRTLKKRLRFQSKTMEEKDIALKVLLQQRENDRSELAGIIAYNFETGVSPYLEMLKQKLRGSDAYKYVELIEKSLCDIVSPFMKEIRKKYPNLTNRELEVASLITEGKTSKEIADIFCITQKAVEFHRMNLRKKLNLSRREMNLRVCLLSIPDQKF